MSQDQARRDFDEMVSRPLPAASFWETVLGVTALLSLAAFWLWFVLMALGMPPWSL